MDTLTEKNQPRFGSIDFIERSRAVKKNSIHSVIPAFLFSYKQKSLRRFFELLRQYTDDRLSLEELWTARDTGEQFGSYKTLYRYHRNLMHQIDRILGLIIGEIISLSSEYAVPDISPGESAAHRKVEIMLQSLDRLVELLHLKGRTVPVLDEEKYAFLHEFLFRKGNIILLQSHHFP